MFEKGIAIACLAAAPIFSQPPSPPPRARSIVTHAMARRGWLGVGLAEVTPERAKALRLKGESGLEITHVDENSPASKAGLKENDVILEVGGQKIEEGEQFARTIGETSPGTKVTLGIWRNGSKQNVTATLESRPGQYFVFAGPDGDLVAALPPMPPFGPDDSPFSILTGQSPRIGFEGEPLTPQLAQYFGVKDGVLVRAVAANTPAEKAGLKAGDVVTKVNGTPVSSLREISGLVHAGHKTVVFTVMRNHKTITLNVEIAGAFPPGSDRDVL